MIQLLKRSAASVTAAAQGKVKFFVGTDGKPQYKDETGTLFDFIGKTGFDGWSPLLAVISDGARRVLQVTGWTGGTGTAPTSGQYLGATGLVTNIAQAVDIRGQAGVDGQVQSVNGRTGAVTLTKADVQLNNVVNPVAVASNITAPVTLTQTLANIATLTIPANTLTAGDTFELEALFSTLVNTATASNLEFAVVVNGTQVALITAALGTTAVAAPGRGGMARARLVFRTVGATGTMIANGVTTVNNLVTFASNVAAAVTINTTASITVAIQARTSAATTTGIVQQASIRQA